MVTFKNKSMKTFPSKLDAAFFLWKRNCMTIYIYIVNKNKSIIAAFLISDVCNRHTPAPKPEEQSLFPN